MELEEFKFFQDTTVTNYEFSAKYVTGLSDDSGEKFRKSAI
jgi:hypothetical protein